MIRIYWTEKVENTESAIFKDFSANELSESLGFKFYPNPASDVVYLEYSLPATATDSKVVISSLIGETVKLVNIYDNAGKLAISTSDFAEGIYIYSIYVDGVLVTNQKLSIIK